MMKDKVIYSIDELFNKLNLESKMTLSFHHHLRNGDYVINMICEEIKRRDIKDLIFAPSSIFPTNKIMVDLIKNQNITKIYTNYLNGDVAKCIGEGYLRDGLVMQTHGGRPRSIEAGELKIDIAFIATPTADYYGNGNGLHGKSACGVLGYAISDMKYAKTKVVVTDNLVDNVDYNEIIGEYIDYVLVVDSIGDKNGIVSGTTKITRDPVGLKIARDTAKLIEQLGLIKDGFSFQTGAGGTSLAVAKEIKKIMLKNNIQGSFISGGITAYLVEMLQDNLFDKIYDVQCFDLVSIESLKQDKNHIPISASLYANPDNKDAIINNLDFVILGATEIDKEFNVNVTTDSNGLIIGGSGGHSDTAACSNVTIIVTQLIKARTSILKNHVKTITTPSSSIDILVTERGIAINPKRIDLLDLVKDTKLNIVSIDTLYDYAKSVCGRGKEINTSQEVIGVVEYRDGSIIDYLYKLNK